MRKKPLTFGHFQTVLNGGRGYRKDGWGWRDIPLPRYFFLPNKTRLLLANHTHALISIITLPYSSGMKNYNMKEFIEIPSFLSLFFCKNTLGKYLLWVVTDSSYGVSSHTMDKHCSMKGDLAATRIIVACHLFQRETGRKPATLDELVPRYLPDVPLDPFDGKPFRYNPDLGVIYSVGESLTDLGGEAYAPDTSRMRLDPTALRDNPWKGDNAVFHIWE